MKFVNYCNFEHCDWTHRKKIYRIIGGDISNSASKTMWPILVFVSAWRCCGNLATVRAMLSKKALTGSLFTWRKLFSAFVKAVDDTKVFLGVENCWRLFFLVSTSGPSDLVARFCERRTRFETFSTSGNFLSGFDTVTIFGTKVEALFDLVDLPSSDIIENVGPEHPELSSSSSPG